MVLQSPVKESWKPQKEPLNEPLKGALKGTEMEPLKFGAQILQVFLHPTGDPKRGPLKGGGLNRSP